MIKEFIFTWRIGSFVDYAAVLVVVKIALAVDPTVTMCPPAGMGLKIGSSVGMDALFAVHPAPFADRSASSAVHPVPLAGRSASFAAYPAYSICLKCF